MASTARNCILLAHFARPPRTIELQNTPVRKGAASRFTHNPSSRTVLLLPLLGMDHAVFPLPAVVVRYAMVVGSDVHVFDKRAGSPT